VCAIVFSAFIGSVRVASADEDSERRRENGREALVMIDSARRVVGPVEGKSLTLFIEVKPQVYAAQIFSTSPLTFTLPSGFPVIGYYTSTDCSGPALASVAGVELIPPFAFIIGTTGYFDPTDQSTPTVTVRSFGYPPTPGFGCESANSSGKYAPWQTVDLTSFLSRFTPPFSISVK